MPAEHGEGRGLGLSAPIVYALSPAARADHFLRVDPAGGAEQAGLLAVVALKEGRQLAPGLGDALPLVPGLPRPQPLSLPLLWWPRPLSSAPPRSVRRPRLLGQQLPGDGIPPRSSEGRNPGLLLSPNQPPL